MQRFLFQVVRKDRLALAVPTNDDHGRLLSTLSFHAPAHRPTLDRAYTHLPRLRRAAAASPPSSSTTGNEALALDKRFLTPFLPAI